MLKNNAVYEVSTSTVMNGGEPTPIAPRPSPNVARDAKEMTDRMMWGIARGVSEKDTATLAALRDMNRAERRRYLARNGKRVRKA